MKGFITVNGKVVKELGTQIDPEKDKIEIIASARPTLGKKITLAFNKPRGIVSSKIKDEGPTIFDLLPEFTYLNTVGRLDKESEGLLLLSNDGAVTSTVTGTDHLIEKEYEVTVAEPVSPSKLSKMEEGVNLEDGITLPAKARAVSRTTFKLTLREGRKHQIRRMCSALHLTILALKRLRVGSITLKGIESGKYRQLTDAEVASLKNAQ